MRTERKPEAEERFILSIDGGGMRGVIPCRILSTLSEMLEKLGDKRPLADHFDLIAGTSTGGLIALALTAPVEKSGLPRSDAEPTFAYEDDKQSFLQRLMKKPVTKHPVGMLPRGVDMNAIRTLYHEWGPRIFGKKSSWLFGSLFDSKYDEGSLEQVLQDMFGDIPLSEAVIPVLAMSYDIKEPGRPMPLVSRDSHGFLFREAARATSAAPTYFNPLSVKDRQTGEDLLLVDGAVVANNPVLYAVREARMLYPNARTFHILSLATRQPALHFTFGSKSGVFGWLDPSQGAPIQKVFSTAQEQTASTIVTTIRGIDYVRLQGELKVPYRMDVYDKEALESLGEDAERMIESNKDELERYAKLLSERTRFDQLKLEAIPPVIG